MDVRSGTEHNEQIHLWPVLKQGLWLGALASIIPNAVWGCGLLGLFVAGSGIEALWSGALAIPGILACLPFGFTVLPALVAGGLNALVLYLVWRRRPIRDRVGLVSGAVLGILWGSIVSSVAWYLNKDNYYSLVDEYVVAIIIGVAALAGCWHGWRMTRYLRRQTRPRQDIKPD